MFKEKLKNLIMTCNPEQSEGSHYQSDVTITANAMLRTSLSMTKTTSLRGSETTEAISGHITRYCKSPHVILNLFQDLEEYEIPKQLRNDGNVRNDGNNVIVSGMKQSIITVAGLLKNCNNMYRRCLC